MDRALRDVAAGRTLLIIAHRLATIASTDRVCVLADGRFAEEGTHEELLSRDGACADLVRAGFPDAPSGTEL